ncbi:MAG: thiolase family protein [Immundisolibacter sp.]|uniref:thiolase family protein n=1 Tax=Immundisolibacter sp. TaxID=1934948 RepID=UPI003EE1EBF8
MPVAVAIAAVSELTPGRYPQRATHALYQDAIATLLAQWPIKPGDIQGLLVAPAGMADGVSDNIFVHERLVEELGLDSTFAETVNVGGSTHAVMAIRAALAIRAGLADGVLCVSAGRFPNVGGGGAQRNTRMFAHPDFDSLYGPYIPPIYAQVATRHMHETGIGRDAMASVAVGQRAWAIRHPQALMAAKGPLTVDSVLAARPIASPFHLLDCSVPCDGGGAFLVASAALARRINPQPAWLRGFGEVHRRANISQLRCLDGVGGQAAAQAAFRMADLTPGDVRLAQLYDSFSYNPILGVEHMGLVPAGQGGRFFLDGRGAPGGDLPVNSNGGLLSFGHTGDASGMSVIAEAALQVMGRAGDRQVSAPVALVHCYGGMMSEHAVLLLGNVS